MVRATRLQKPIAPMQTDGSTRRLPRNSPDYHRLLHWCAPAKRGLRKFVSRPTLLPEGVCGVLMISVSIVSAEILDSRNSNLADYVIAKSVKPNQYKINLPIHVKRLRLSAKCTPLWTISPNSCRQDIASSTTSGEYPSSSEALYSFLSDPTSSQQLRGARFVFITDADIPPPKTFPTCVLESPT